MCDVQNILCNTISDTSEDITIVLSVHSRPEYFERLITEIDKVKYHSIWISCCNSPNYHTFQSQYEVLKKKTTNKLFFFHQIFNLNILEDFN